MKLPDKDTFDNAARKTRREINSFCETEASKNVHVAQPIIDELEKLNAVEFLGVLCMALAKQCKNMPQEAKTDIAKALAAATFGDLELSTTHVAEAVYRLMYGHGVGEQDV